MGLMVFMETMGMSGIPIVAAFFIGLMTAISPCPLATNITAIAYISKKIDGSKNTLLVGVFYTLGRMFSYVALASLIVWFGMRTQVVSLFLQGYGEKIIGPLLLVIGIIMLDILKLNFFRSSDKLNKLKERLARKGLLGSFLLGVVFALAFCPFSAVLFFGMLVPLALKMGDGLIIPAVFALATGLPVIIFSMVLARSVSKLGKIMNRVQTFELWMRRVVAVIFIMVGLYYISSVVF
ncbi:MAG: aromatic aminobenezylarsenical efflux permease ArsG family transporter [archaeon]